MASFRRFYIEDLHSASTLRSSFTNDVENPSIANGNSETGY